jgi:Tol biopolymer transport system component
MIGRRAKQGSVEARAPLAVLGALVLTATFGVTALQSAPAMATFPGHNGRILYDDNTKPDFLAPDNYRIESANPDGSSPQVVLDSPGSAQDGCPRTSPNGKHLALMISNGESSAMYAGQIDGSHLKRLTAVRGNDVLDCPNWSPDGKRLIYARDQFTDAGQYKTGGIYTIKPDGSDNKLVRRFDGKDANVPGQPAYSPDGAHIAFELQVKAPHSKNIETEIYVAKKDGAGARRVTSYPNDALAPDYAPDGKHIAFYFFDGDFNEQVAVMSANGSGKHVLGPGADPRYSPHGDFITYDGGLEYTGVHVMGANGSGPHVIDSSQYANSPDWSVPGD